MKTKIVKAYGIEALNAPLHSMNIKRRELLPLDLEMEILYCGICHSDLHQIKNEFGGAVYPMVPGHEIVGKVTRIGEQVKKFKIGDLSAIGCIIDSCGECESCKDGSEQFCDAGVTFSFNSPDKYLGGFTYGGFSENYVSNEKYVLHIPETLDLASSAPLLCAGITTYSPLKHWQAGPGKKIGILGVGGLGHLAIKIAKAMGAHVIAFTTSPSKVEDAKHLGADEAVLSKEAEQMKKYNRKIDLIIDTVSAKHDVNIYLNLLKHDGSVVLVGLPPEPLEVQPFSVVTRRHSFSGSNIGGIAETQEMLYFCAKYNIKADIELINVSQINEAFDRLKKGDVHYRFVVDMASLKTN